MSLIVCGAQRCYKYMKGEWHPMYMDADQRGKELLEFIVHIIAGVLAAGIAYNRMEGSSLLMRILAAIVAFMFGLLYLVYVVGVMALGDEKERGKYQTAMAEALQGGDVMPLV